MNIAIQLFDAQKITRKEKKTKILISKIWNKNYNNKEYILYQRDRDKVKREELSEKYYYINRLIEEMYVRR